jgi:hypothetical protein
MLEMADRDPGLARDVVEAHPLFLARSAQAFADRSAEQLVLLKFRHQTGFAPILFAPLQGNMSRPT